ncbi:DUF2877 domain-containing protein [bacterium]|nr:DUF2877 domain-containing protein [bacterium]
MDIYEIGDRLPLGIFSLHSKFNKYCNFVNEYGELITLTTEKSGPNTITVSERVLKSSTFIKVTSEILEINFDKYKKRSIPIYCSKIESQNNLKKTDLIEDNWSSTILELKKIYNYLKIRVGDKTLLSAIELGKNSVDKILIQERKYRFSELMFKEIESGVELFLDKNFEQAISKIKGHGFGLTPSGDDWLAGALTGISFYEEYFNKNLKNIKESIFNLSIGKNLISNSFIYYAKESSFFYDVKQFLTSILKSNFDSLYQLGINVLEHGATSGGDFLSGFFSVILKKDFFDFS